MIKQIGQPGWVVEEQPANHCLKPCGLPIDSCISTPWTTTGTVSPPSDQVLFRRIQKGFQALKGLCLRISTHNGDNGLMQSISLPWSAAEPQALMEFPDRITNPGQLQGANRAGHRVRLLRTNPGAQAAI